MFQSTPPHGGRPPDPPSMHSHSSVSIHAPAWGATVGLVISAHAHGVSIHAPAWGATINEAPDRINHT